MSELLCDFLKQMHGEILRPKNAAPRPDPESAVKLELGRDGVWLVEHNGRTVGWVNPIKVTPPHGGYRALSIHGEIKHFDGKQTAIDWLLASFH